MNTSRNLDSEGNSSETISTFSVDQSGNVRTGRTKKDKSVYCHKKAREDQATRVKGCNGIGEEQEQELYNLTTCLWNLYPNRLAWMILKYKDLTPKQYENLHKHWDKFIKKVKDYLYRRYKKILNIDKLTESDSVIPYILKFELSPVRTNASGKPHFDINICLLYLDENGKPYFNERQLASDLYRKMSDVADDHIPVPADHYFELIELPSGELRNWSSYFCKRTDVGLLNKIKVWGNDCYLPKKWLFRPDELARWAKHRERVDSDIPIKQENAIVKDELNELEKVEENKNGMRGRMPLEGYNSSEIADRVEKRFSDVSGNVERY